MRLKKFRIQNYKIIDDTGWIQVDENVTSLVGKNGEGQHAVPEWGKGVSNTQSLITSTGTPLSFLSCCINTCTPRW